MANASAKKLAIQNDRILDNLRKGFMVVHIAFLGYRVVYNWSTFVTSQLALYVLTSGVSMFMYSTLENTGRPTYDATGTLVKAGEDMNAEGLTAYMFDIIYVTWFTQIMAAFVSTKFWYSFLVIPAYALYKVLPMIVSYIRQARAQGGEEPEGSKSKRQEKMEKKAKKGNVKYVR